MARRVDRTARRDQILQAAVGVFASKGFAATRVEDIASAAGVGKGSVYLYFESREGILAAAFADYTARSGAIVSQAARLPGPALERLDRLIRSVLTLVSSERDLARVVIDLWANHGDTTPSGLDMATVYAEYREAITDLLRQASAEGAIRVPAAEPYAAVVVGAIEGCLLQWLLDPRLPIERLADPLVDVCLHGIRTGAPA